MYSQLDGGRVVELPQTWTPWVQHLSWWSRKTCINQCWALGSHFGIPTWDLGWDLGSQRGIPKMGWDFWTLQGSLLSNPYTKSEGGRPSHPRILGKLPEKGIPSTKYHLGSQMGSHRFLGSHMGYHLGSQHWYIRPTMNVDLSLSFNIVGEILSSLKSGQVVLTKNMWNCWK